MQKVSLKTYDMIGPSAPLRKPALNTRTSSSQKAWTKTSKSGLKRGCFFCYIQFNDPNSYRAAI